MNAIGCKPGNIFGLLIFADKAQMKQLVEIEHASVSAHLRIQNVAEPIHWRDIMIRKLKSGEFRLYSRKKDASTGKKRNLGTFSTMEKAEQHEREVQYFKKH